jgi:hypothetical protein
MGNVVSGVDVGVVGSGPLLGLARSSPSTTTSTSTSMTVVGGLAASVLD